MQSTTLGELFFNPGFLSIFFAILVTIANVMIGVSMLPADKRRKRYKFHRYVFFAVLLIYGYFLAWNHFSLGKNSLLNFFVFVYFACIIPLSRKANVTAHAIISSVGLVLLTLVAVLHMG
ncbi:MAG: hypothetical protein NPINA01_11260 [Nitrospinaceae bacterium]|nr:MAG: hypothetical protein NPINA01_11260 [Nitrospinaceae bacterium]